MILTPKPLTQEKFAPYGEVIDPANAEGLSINDGTSVRLNDLCTIDVSDGSGRPSLNIFKADPRPLPIKINMLERHPLGSQCFLPMNDEEFFLVVAPEGKQQNREAIRAFHARRGQGVNYAKGTWHFPLIAPRGGKFIVIDRQGEEENCDIIQLTDQLILKSG